VAAVSVAAVSVAAVSVAAVSHRGRLQVDPVVPLGRRRGLQVHSAVPPLGRRRGRLQVDPVVPLGRRRGLQVDPVVPLVRRRGMLQVHPAVPPLGRRRGMLQVHPAVPPLGRRRGMLQVDPGVPVGRRGIGRRRLRGVVWSRWDQFKILAISAVVLLRHHRGARIIRFGMSCNRSVYRSRKWTVEGMPPNVHKPASAPASSSAAAKSCHASRLGRSRPSREARAARLVPARRPQGWRDHRARYRCWWARVGLYPVMVLAPRGQPRTNSYHHPEDLLADYEADADDDEP